MRGLVFRGVGMVNDQGRRYSAPDTDPRQLRRDDSVSLAYRPCPDIHLDTQAEVVKEYL